jgi:hypothetical protein
MELCQVVIHGRNYPLRCSYHAASRLAERKVNVASMCRSITRVLVSSEKLASRIAIRDYSQHTTAILAVESDHIVMVTCITCANRAIKDAQLLN